MDIGFGAVRRTAWTDNQCKFIENAIARQSLPDAGLAPSGASVGIGPGCHRSGGAMLKTPYHVLRACCWGGVVECPRARSHPAKIEVPGANFEMLVATAKPGGAIYDFGESPDALVIHLIGAKLWVGFDDAAKMLETIDILRRPLGSFHVDKKRSRSHRGISDSESNTLAGSYR